MTVRFLLFRGKWAHEGTFGALETEKSIVIFAAGQDYSLTNLSAQQLGRDYLKEKNNKVQGIVLTNTNFRNISLLESICYDLGPHIIIYASYHSKIILTNLLPKLRNKIMVIEPEVQDWKIGDFTVNFLPLNGYLLGNLGIVYHYYNYSFYFLEDFAFSSLLNNKLFTQPNFFSHLGNFLAQKKLNNYLITSFQNIHWYNNNSLFLAKNYLPSHLNNVLFFIFYDFDWLHIIELLELVWGWKKKIVIINTNFATFLRKILMKNHLEKVIVSNEKNQLAEIYLLVTNPKNPIEKIDYYLQSFSPIQKAQFHFILGLPPVVGGEEKLARLLDYLYTQSSKITNFSKNKNEYLRLGISFSDLQLLLNLLQPIATIILHHSYKNEKFLTYLPGKFLSLDNNHYWDFSSKKLIPFSNKKNLISLEEMLIEQRKKLGQMGMLVICLIAEWKEKQLRLKRIRLETAAITSILSTNKLEGKIKKWWDSKLVRDLKKSDPIKTIKKAVERRLNSLINSFVSLEYGLELEEALILLFIH